MRTASLVASALVLLAFAPIARAADPTPTPTPEAAGEEAPKAKKGKKGAKPPAESEEKAAETAAEKPGAKEPDTGADAAAADKPTEKSADKPADKAVEPGDAKEGEKAAEKPADKKADAARPVAPSKYPDADTLKKLDARFAPVDIKAETGSLPPNERRALAQLVKAAKIMDTLFMRQVWGGSETKLLELSLDPSPLGRARFQYFVRHKGPWDRQDENKGFLPDVPPTKPEGGNFYPPGSKKADIESWIEGLGEKEKAAATGFFTTIRRGADGKMMAVPYSVEYQGELAEAARLLRDAAKNTQNASLRTYLNERARAFLTNDYYASDVAWMELDSPIEPTIGPYETYEDAWFSYKAAFEAFITLRDDAETEKLAKFAAELQGLENNLPIDKKLRNPKIGSLAPIRVVNVVFTAGDANRGVQTAAFNLPNDERVIKEKGSKRVMLKNIQEAKFEQVLKPIVNVALAEADRGDVTFDAFFTHILMHELMHGLGPHEVQGGKGTVREALKENSSALEEAKADISGLWALQFLIDKGKLDKSLQKSIYKTYVASAFRTLRFGATEAHGKGMALQLNTLLDYGGVVVAKDGTFGVNEKKFRKAMEALTRDIMTVQAKGNYDLAKKMLDGAVVRPPVQAVLDKLTEVPIDIAPRFVTAAQLTQR